METRNRTPLTIGMFLGVRPRNGGMFQYAQSVVEALTRLPPADFRFEFAYVDVAWIPILARLNVSGRPVRCGVTGMRFAEMAMLAGLPCRAARKFGRWLNPLARNLSALNCDYWIFPAQDAMSYQFEGKSIGTIHDLMHRYERSFPEVGSWLRYRTREHRFRGIAEGCIAILVDSDLGRRHVMDCYGTSGGKIHVLPYVHPGYLRTSSTRVDFDVHYSLPAKFLYYPAQFWPHKNHKTLFDAIGIVASFHPDIALVLTGAKRHAFEDVRAATAASGVSERVCFVGHVPDSDIRGFYERARALVMPTFFGPTNIPPLEAHALGCPVLVSDVYAMRDQLGDAALYFNPASAEDMADKIRSIWADDRLAKRLSLMGLARTDSHGQDQFDRRVSDILKQITGR
ncbi:MAG TPA: glycosyltransferase family 1 protein [Steroidobacteraceae bacterium]|nr:glycosyltransferase family 1 protein [Steroidobacteraceae bacterium]